MKNIFSSIKNILDNHPVWMMLIAVVVGAGMMMGIEGDDVTELVGLTAGAVSAILGVGNFIRAKAISHGGEGKNDDGGTAAGEKTDTETEQDEP